MLTKAVIGCMYRDGWSNLYEIMDIRDKFLIDTNYNKYLLNGRWFNDYRGARNKQPRTKDDLDLSRKYKIIEG
jgi:hypothetical protein